MRFHAVAVLSTIVVILATSPQASAGIFEVFGPGSGVRKNPGLLYQFRYFRIHDGTDAPDAQQLPSPRPPIQTSFLDGLLHPVVLIRTLGVSTFEDVVSTTTADGRTLMVDSSNADPSQFGHREGFVLDNAELGLKGRHGDSGIYYSLKAELIPREKDGNRSSDYLKDAYLGWDMYRWLDLRVGRMKVPFSQANMKPTEDRPLAYSPNLDTLVPKRQLGIQVSGGDPWQIARLTGGVFNSTGLAVEQIRKQDQIMLVGRGELNLGNALRAAGLQTYDLEFSIAGNVAWVKENYDPRTEHRWVGIDARFHLWLFTVEGEWVVKDFFTNPPGSPDRKADRGYGWHVDLTVHALPTILDLTGRVEFLDGDRAERGTGSSLSIDELSRQKSMWISGGLTIHVAKQARLAFNYIHRKELEGFSFRNDVLVALFQMAL